jgi:transposase
MPWISQRNRLRRLEWCHEHEDWTIQQWRKVLWSDESPFELRCKRRFRVWRRPSERFDPKNCKGTVKHDKKIMVWGCFSAHGVGKLHRIKGILDQHGYHSILQRQMKESVQQLFPENDCTFQHDNDPKHTAKLNKRYLENCGIPTLAWPSQSPDLNPIENLWAIVDQRVKDRAPKNEDKLFELLTEAWQALDAETLTKLADSMPERIQAVIARNGWPTKY